MWYQQLQQSYLLELSPYLPYITPVRLLGMSNSASTIDEEDRTRLKERIASLVDLTLLATGELHTAIYRAHLAGMPTSEITLFGNLKPGELERIIASFQALPSDELEDELEAEEMTWRVVNGLGTFG